MRPAAEWLRALCSVVALSALACAGAAKLVEKAEVDEMVQNPLHPYAQALLNAIPDPEPENVAKLRDVPPGEPPNLINPPTGCRFHPRCPHVIKGLCDAKEPPEFEPSPDHFVECWLYKTQESDISETVHDTARTGDQAHSTVAEKE